MNLHKKPNDLKPLAGRLLIAEPFLNDPNFVRSVVLLCEHGEDGTVGFVLNNPTDITLQDLLDVSGAVNLKIYQGGPVQVDTLHMVHRMPEILGGKEIAPGIFWGGSYEALQEALLINTCRPEDIRLFVGYSGWSPGQLDSELNDGAWLVTEMSEKVIFEEGLDNAWKEAIRLLGKDFAFLEHLPTDPSLN